MQLIGRSILEVVDSNLDESTDYCDLGFWIFPEFS
jgi:hypothetical protein